MSGISIIVTFEDEDGTNRRHSHLDQNEGWLEGLV